MTTTLSEKEAKAHFMLGVAQALMPDLVMMAKKSAPSFGTDLGRIQQAEEWIAEMKARDEAYWKEFDARKELATKGAD